MPKLLRIRLLAKRGSSRASDGLASITLVMRTLPLAEFRQR